MTVAAWGLGGVVVGWVASECIVALIRARHRHYQELRCRKRTRL